MVAWLAGALIAGMFTACSGPSREGDKLTLKRVVDFVTDKQDEREMNKKLQLLLEETLTKNMHLQKVGCLATQVGHYSNISVVL